MARMSIKRPRLLFEGIQIKSQEAFCRFTAAVQEIEERAGIHEVEIVLKDIFFCPWIDIDACKSTPMERLLIGMIESMNRG